MAQHRQEFRHELEAIEAKVVELFNMVAEDLPAATDALLSVNSARRASHILNEDLSPRSRGFIEQMGSVTSDMWRQAVDAWCQRDRAAAVALDERDDEMDDLYGSLMAELGSGRMTLPVTMELTLVARFYERLADHAVNIARRVVYLAGHAPR